MCVCVCAGERSSIFIGVCSKAYPADIVLGLREASVAIHTADEGTLLHFPLDPQSLGVTFSRGSVLRCALVPDPLDSTSCLAEFFKEGERVGVVSLSVPEGGLYGVVGMTSCNERVLLSPPVISRRLEFDQIWDVQNLHIHHERAGLCLYVGPGHLNEETVGTVRMKQRIDPFGPLNRRSFEIRIVDPGHKTYIAVGICSRSYQHNMLPGWRDMSVGYHADNGGLLHNSECIEQTGQLCRKGDTLRCTVHPTADGSKKEVSVVFHCNSHVVGKLIAWVPEEGFYGIFGMMSKRECVQVFLPEIQEPYVPPKLSFLSVWEPLTPTLQYRDNGVFEHVGEGGYDFVGSVRSKQPLNPVGPGNTFEVKIIDPGESCYIALGVCSSSFPATKLPGWSENSVGFHADNGLILNGIGNEKLETRCNCIKGDVIRCTLEPVDGSQKQLYLSFHRNGVPIGRVMLWNCKGGFYAQVGSMSRGEVIQIASPQTTPSSLTHDPPPRSMSIPTEPVRKWRLTQEYSRMTPAVREDRHMEPFSEHLYRVKTAPVLPSELSQSHNIHISQTPRVMPDVTGQPQTHLHQDKPTQGSPLHSLSPSHVTHTLDSTQMSDSQEVTHIKQRQSSLNDSHTQHQLSIKVHQPSPTDSPSERSISLAHLASSEYATTASPFPLQPLGGHPLVQRETNASEPQFQDQQSSFFASQVSAASAASDLDPHYQSQSSTDSQAAPRQRATSGSHPHHVPPHEYSRRFRAQTQPVTNRSQHTATPPPSGASPSTRSPLHSYRSGPRFHTGPVERGYYKPGFEEPESPTALPGPSPFDLSPKHQTLESEYEPVKEVEVLATPELRLYTKKENSHCRVLHNASCSEDGTLHCTLSDNSCEPCFVMRQLQLTEKMPYFEVELVEHDPIHNVVVGLVPRDHPYTVPMGSVSRTIAYHTATGSVLAGGEKSSSLTKACTARDVIGCKVDWTYKLEACGRESDTLVGVEWFLNGCSVTKKTVSVPSSGFYPALEMTSRETVLVVRHSMGLTPESYFTSHPLPENFRNIEIVPQTIDTWKCIQNVNVDENGLVFLQKPGKTSSLPAIVQSNTHFSTVQPYFEVELQHPTTSYSLLSVGALERLSDSESSIPGEAPNSIALFPLLGLVMCNGAISTTLPLSIEEEIKSLSGKLTIGVGVDFNQSVPQHGSISATTRRVAIFFTINNQLINSTYVAIPPAGLHPTVAVSCDATKMSDCLLRLQFSNPRPQASALPLGFARAPHGAFKVSELKSVVAESSFCSGQDTPQTLQAALPFSRSHTYFEFEILECGESHVFSCGAAPHNYPLVSHPGDLRDSIGFFSNEGSVHCNGRHYVVSSPFHHKGAVMGCGARFPDNGSSKYVEVFFTQDRRMVARRLVEVSEPGLFPTLGFYTKGSGVARIDLNAEDPFPELKFSTAWMDLRNMAAEGAFLQPTSSSETCMAQLLHPVPRDTPVYFTVSPTADTNARVLIGFTNSAMCPLLDDHQPPPASSKEVSDPPKLSTTLEHSTWAGGLVDITEGQAVFEGTGTLCGIEHCSTLKQFALYGCGIEPIAHRKSHLFFITRNNQVVFVKIIHLRDSELFPTVFLRGSAVRMCVDACALWPLRTAIGQGWARVHHLFLENSKIRHTSAGKRHVMPVGFAQSAMPLTSTSSYFEVEVCSRSIEKAIAVGLASRTYPSDTWVGWAPISIAYHLDDGCLFTGDGLKGHCIGPKIFEGHVVGCGINVRPEADVDKGGDIKVEVFFTVNGALIVEQKISAPIEGFYPTICLEGPTESVIFHRYPRFPPVRNLMGPNWANCYSVHQAGLLVEHSYQHKEIPAKGIPRGFCQASRPFSPNSSYFEITIVRSTAAATVQMGVSVRLPVGCRSPNTDSVIYYTNGQVLLRSGGRKSTTYTEKSTAGDVVGCEVVYAENTPTAVQFYLNKMKVAASPLEEKWRSSPLFPTIVLSHPDNVVLPRLNLSPPKWDRSSLIGWLRTERVQVKGNIASYNPPDHRKKPEVGLCQLSQCLEQEHNSSFEVEVLNQGEKCCIAVGAASTTYPAVNQPGWLENSVAYHGDDGQLFSNDPNGVSFGSPWKERDIIGVGVRRPAYKNPKVAETQVYFVKNGVELGHTTVPVPPSGFFPTIGFHSPGEKVKITLHSSSQAMVNFNQALLQWRDVCGMKLELTSQENQFVLQYFENGRKTPFTGIKPAIGIYGEPFSEKLQYFELDLITLETSSTVAIGVVPPNYSLELAPGWGKDSIGYHSENGQLYQARDRGKYFGPIAKKGDSIGCGISLTPNSQYQCSIFFTYNGVEIGTTRATIPTGGFYPCICLMQQHDKVRATFSDTFKPKVSIPEMNMVGLMRISNCSYADQIVQFSGSSAQGLTSPGFAQFALPMHKDHNFFAVHILKAEDTIAIGLAVKDYPLRYLPGSMSISIAYDVTKGSIKAVYDSTNFHRFNEPEFVCSVGDRVGCGMVSSCSKTQPGFVYFTRNGVVLKRIMLGELFEDLYPAVGFMAEKRASLLFMDWKVPLYDSPNLLFDC